MMVAFDVGFEHILADGSVGVARLAGEVAEASAGDLEVAVSVRVIGVGWFVDLPHRLHEGNLVRPILRGDGRFATLDDLDAQRDARRRPPLLRLGANPLSVETNRLMRMIRRSDEGRRRDDLSTALGRAVVVDGVPHWPAEEPFYGITMLGDGLHVTVWTEAPTTELLVALPIDGEALRTFEAAYREVAGIDLAPICERVRTSPGFATRRTPGDLVGARTFSLAAKWFEPFLQRMLGEGSTLGFELERAFERRASGDAGPEGDEEAEDALLVAAADAMPRIHGTKGDEVDASSPEVWQARNHAARDLVASVAAVLRERGTRTSTPAASPRLPRPTLWEALSRCDASAMAIGRHEGVGSLGRDDPHEGAEELDEEFVTRMVEALPEPTDAFPQLGAVGRAGWVTARRPEELFAKLWRYEGVVGEGDGHVTVLTFSDAVCTAWVKGWVAKVHVVARPSTQEAATIAALAAASGDRYLPNGNADLRDDAGRMRVIDLVDLARDACEEPLGTIVLSAEHDPIEGVATASARFADLAAAEGGMDDDLVDDEAPPRRSEGFVIAVRIVDAIVRTHGPSFLDHARKVRTSHPNLASSFVARPTTHRLDDRGRPPSATQRHLARAAARRALLAWLEGPGVPWTRRLARDARRVWSTGNAA